MIGEQNRFQKGVGLLLASRDDLPVNIDLLELFRIDELAPCLGSLLLNEGFLLVVRGVVEDQCLSKLLADAEAHHVILGEVTQRGQSLVAFDQSGENRLSSLCANRILRDINLVKNRTLLKKLSKLEGKLVVKEIPMEVHIGDTLVDHQCVQQVAGSA